MRGRLLFAAGLITATISLSFAARAAVPQNVAKNESKEVRLDTAAPARIYDAEHHDYHVWDGNEQRAYRRFWEFQHRKYRDYSKLNPREISHYWVWRHSRRGRIAERP